MRIIVIEVFTLLMCETKNKERLNIMTRTKDELKRMSDNKELICPDCKGILVYCHGEIKIPYFRHKSKYNCENSGETEEHRIGKIMLFDLINKLFPESYVDLEYKILETNQRADVICIHPNGERIVFEMQCSKIDPEEWAERTKLYERAGIKQYWFAGRKLVRKLEEEYWDGYYSYKLMNLASQFLKSDEHLYFLDTKNKKFHLLYKYIGKSGYDNWSFPKVCEADISEIEMYKGKLITKKIKEEFRKKVIEI
jgi:competence protein CoiA